MNIKDFKNTDEYKSLLEDCEAIIIEKEFENRFSIIEGYHQLGLRILEIPLEVDVNLDSLLSEVARTIKQRKSKLEYAVKFASLFPDLADLKMGKNISWNKIVKTYLQEKDETLPALPDNDKLKVIINENKDWLVENLKQNKKGINLFLPYEKL